MNFLYTFVYTIIVAIVGSLTVEAVKMYLYRRRAGPNSSLKGIWAAQFRPVSPSNSHSIEIFRLRSWRNKVRISIDNYNNSRTEVFRLFAVGVQNSSQVAAVYQFEERHKLDIGAFVLRIRGDDTAQPILTGYYLQVVDRVGTKTAELVHEEYEWRKVRLPLLHRLRRLLRRTYFASHQEAADFLQQAKWQLDT